MDTQAVRRSVDAHILLVEDDPTSASVLRASLERLGHAVTLAWDGLEAWGHLRGGEVRLVVTDWVMPRLDGPGLCRRIRAAEAEEGRPDTYVILMTSLSEPGRRVEGLEAGADDFLAKRPDSSELAARLRIAERILRMQAELEEKNRRLAELAATDGLTGLRNRRAFEESLRSASSLAARCGSPLSVVLLDVDHFKSYNDAHGHEAGDLVLKELGEVLRASARGHDLAARYGGEEFVLLLPETDAEGACDLAERLRREIERRGWPHRPVTASFGVATTGTLEAAGLVAAADRALYASKARGRNRVTHCRGLTGHPRRARVAGRCGR